MASIQLCCERDASAAHPITDVVIQLVAGSFRETESWELSFKMAGALALKDALDQAAPFVFECGVNTDPANAQLDVRPAVVVSAQDPLDFDGLIICVPLTTRSRRSPYEVEIDRQPFLDRALWAFARGVTAFERRRLLQPLGKVSSQELAKVRAALKYLLEL